MEDDAKKRMRAVVVVIAVILGIGLAVFSGVHNLAETPPHVVGSLGANPQGTPPTGAQTATDPAMGGGKAASDKN